jgi:hypothetical protein
MAPDELATGHPLCHFVPHSCCSRWLWLDWWECIGRPTVLAWPILDMVAISLGVEGLVCEEHDGCVNIYNDLFCKLQGSGVSLPRW